MKGRRVQPESLESAGKTKAMHASLLPRFNLGKIITMVHGSWYINAGLAMEQTIHLVSFIVHHYLELK